MTARQPDVVRGSEKVFRGIRRTRTDALQLKAVLAVEIIKALDRER